MPDFRVGKPRFKAVRNTNQACAAGFNAVIWESIVFDDIAGWDGATDWICDRAGLYSISARAGRLAVSPSASMILGVGVNGTVFQFARAGTATAAATGGGVSELLELANGDGVQLYVQGSGSVAWTLDGQYCEMSITRVGPVAWT